MRTFLAQRGITTTSAALSATLIAKRGGGFAQRLKMSSLAVGAITGTNFRGDQSDFDF